MSMKLFSKAAGYENPEMKKRLLEDIDYVSKRLENIRECYDMTSEPELVDALIYEEKAMRSRFDYLIRIAKENNIKCRIFIRE